MVTRILRISVFAALAASFVASPTVQGVVVPFREGFNTDAADWFNNTSTAEVGWSSTGGPDGSGYAATTFNFVGSSQGDTPALFRGHDEFNSSGGAFVGNWVSNGVSALSVAVRHDAGAPVTFFVRFAGPNNFPGGVGVASPPVPSGVWTWIRIPLPDPNMVFEGPFTHNDVFSSIGHVQIGVLAPASLVGVNQVVTFDVDQVTIATNIPAVSEWGVAVMALLTLTAGTLLLRTRFIGARA